MELVNSGALTDEVFIKDSGSLTRNMDKGKKLSRKDRSTKENM